MQWYYRSVTEWACLPLYILHKQLWDTWSQYMTNAIRKALEINREVFKNQFDTIKYNLFPLTKHNTKQYTYFHFPKFVKANLLGMVCPQRTSGWFPQTLTPCYHRSFAPNRDAHSRISLAHGTVESVWAFSSTYVWCYHWSFPLHSS